MKRILTVLSACLLCAIAGQVWADDIANMYSGFSSAQWQGTKEGWGYSYLRLPSTLATGSLNWDSYYGSLGGWRTTSYMDTITKENYTGKIKMTAGANEGSIMCWYYFNKPVTAWIDATVTPCNTWSTGCTGKIYIEQWDYNNYTTILSSYEYAITQSSSPIHIVVPVNLQVGDGINFTLTNTSTTAGSICSAYWTANITDIAPPGVPEPSAAIALLSGIFGLVGYTWKKRS